jgi:hypothetical protein
MSNCASVAQTELLPPSAPASHIHHRNNCRLYGQYSSYTYTFRFMHIEFPVGSATLYRMTNKLALLNNSKLCSRSEVGPSSTRTTKRDRASFALCTVLNRVGGMLLPLHLLFHRLVCICKCSAENKNDQIKFPGIFRAEICFPFVCVVNVSIRTSKPS